ncbi:MAG: peptidoglycan-binding protein [Rhodobacteraceae bacterium]|nr:peptidoglycan-binding protein [Paracoccaceae bacterium]
MAPVQPVFADSLGAGLVGGVLGGIIGGAIVNQNNKNRQNHTYYAPAVSSGQRADNVQVQTALNYFGFPVGGADGVLGGQSRAQIAQYQAFLGYPATGDLTPFQHDLLVNGYNRAIAGGSATMQQAAANPMGSRGLLITYRDEMAGVNQPPAKALMQPAPDVTETAQPQLMQPAAPAANTMATLPNFGAGAVMTVSLASQCSKIGLTTASNGGFITVANMTDPNAALAEQFCMARTYAISQGEEMQAKVQGFTPDQIAQQCQGFAPAMKDYIGELATKPRDAVLSDVNGFVNHSGMAPAQLDATAKICLSVGYRTDNMDVALASGLLLVALGNKPYAELIGHHLSQGFGTTTRPDMALSWYQMSLDALAAGQPAVFAPGQPERAMLIRKAAYAVAGQADNSPQPAALPSFAVPAPAAATTVSASASDAQPAPAAGGDATSTVDQLPLAARLPFLLFKQ